MAMQKISCTSPYFTRALGQKTAPVNNGNRSRKKTEVMDVTTPVKPRTFASDSQKEDEQHAASRHNGRLITSPYFRPVQANDSLPPTRRCRNAAGIATPVKTQFFTSNDHEPEQDEQKAGCVVVTSPYFKIKPSWNTVPTNDTPPRKKTKAVHLTTQVRSPFFAACKQGENKQNDLDDDYASDISLERVEDNVADCLPLFGGENEGTEENAACLTIPLEPEFSTDILNRVFYSSDDNESSISKEADGCQNHVTSRKRKRSEQKPAHPSLIYHSPAPSLDIALSSDSGCLREQFYQLWLAKPVLIQESLASNPWKLLLAVSLLNKTAGKLAIPIFHKVIERWSTPEALSQAKMEDIVPLIKPLGLYNKRARHFIHLSQVYLEDPPKNTIRMSKTPHYAGYFYVDTLRYSHTTATAPSESRPRYRRRRLLYPMTPISHLPGIGPYALDSYRIFCAKPKFNDWKNVIPEDKEVMRYLKWKWAFEERKVWSSKYGVTGDIDLCYLIALTEELIATRPY